MNRLVYHIDRLVKGTTSPKANKDKSVEINISGNRIVLHYFEFDHTNSEVKVYKSWDYDFSDPCKVESNAEELAYLLSHISLENEETSLDQEESGDRNNG